MTRARKRLILTWAKYRRRYGGGDQERSTPSRFLSEVPEPLIVDLGQREDAGEINLIPAVAVAGQVLRPLAFEINAGQIVEHQTDCLGEGPLVELLFQAHPVAGELIHRGVNIVLIKRLLGLQPAGLGQPGTLRLLSQGELGAGKEQAAINGGLEQSALAGRADARKEFSQPEA